MTFGTARSKFCIIPSDNQWKTTFNHSPCFYTIVQPAIIPNVPYDFILLPPARCASANSAFPIVRLPTRPLSPRCTTKLSLILLTELALPSEISTLRYFVENHSYNIILTTKTWLTGCILTNQIFLSSFSFSLNHRTNRRKCGCLA